MSFLGCDEDLALEALLHLDAAILAHKAMVARLKHHCGRQVAADLTVSRVLLFECWWQLGFIAGGTETVKDMDCF